MKKLITFFALMSTLCTQAYAISFEENTLTKANAVFGLMKCEAVVEKNGIENCENEIQNAQAANISDLFIFELLSKRNLYLSDKVDGHLSNWFWVKTSAALDRGQVK